MKALRSALAKQLLADPGARAQLRQFVGPAAGNDRSVDASNVTVLSNGKEVRYHLVIVPKAA